MNKSSLVYIRLCVVLGLCSSWWLRSAEPVAAQSGVTITSPANGAVLAAGPDYATDLLGDGWDFSNREDVALDPAQLDGFSSFTVANGLAGGMLAPTRGGAVNGSNVYLLQRAYWGILNPGRTGRRFPVTSTAFTKLAFKMSSTRADQFPRVIWFHNDLGDPAGDGSGWRYVDPATPSPAGNNIFVVDLTQANHGVPWTSGAIKGVAIYPNSSAVNYPVQFDWVRLTTGDTNASSKVVPVTWSGGSGTATIQVRDAAGATFTVATGITGTSYNWNYGVLPPGTYTLTIVRGGVASAARTFRINTPPAITITDPDETGGDDFATTVLGNPWDMQDTADFRYDGGATIVDHLSARSVSGGRFHGTSDGQIIGSVGSVPMGDPQLYLLSNGLAGNTSQVVDTRRYHRLTFSLQVDRSFDLMRGSVARVFWGAATSPTGGGAPYTGLSITKDIITWPGMNTYSIDLAPLNGGADGGLEPGFSTTWTAQNVRHLRIDPFEFGERLDFHYGPVKLAADDETKNGSFTIRWIGSDADGDAATVALYYDTNLDPSSGLAPIASGIALGTGQYVWNASQVPAGTYYIYAVATDGRNGTGRYSTGPVRVTGGGGPAISNPQMSVDTPVNNTTGGATVSISGWAVDLGAASGSGVDRVVAYADPGTTRQVYLGQASYGAARPDVGGAFGAQFAGSAFTLQASGLTDGTHTIAVYAHSSVSGANNVRTFTYTVQGGAPLMTIDQAGNGTTCAQPCQMSGWAIDSSAASGTGVDAVHVYAFRNGAGAPIFVGVSQYGTARSDVGAMFGSRFTNSGYQLQVRGLAPGAYQLVAYARSTRTNTFNNVKGVTLAVSNAPRMSIDVPGQGASVPRTFMVSGWAIDLAAASGPGVDAIHVYAFPAGSSTPRLVGVARTGVSRPDVGTAFRGSQFNASGYNLTVNPAVPGPNDRPLPPGVYDLAVYAHSTVSGAFDNVQVVRVTVR